jgi:hypothetical protein
MTIAEIRKAFPAASDVTVAEIWLHDVAREAGADMVEAEFGFKADENGEYALTEAEAAKVLAQ